jgi:hypothetical protein
MAAVSLAIACGGNGGGDELTGTGDQTSFTATITGASAGSYNGISTAVPSSGLFSIGMSSTDGKFALGFTRNGTRPAVGIYPLGTDPKVGFTAALRSGDAMYTSTAGTLTVTSSSATQIQGSFSFTGSTTPPGGAAANVSGSFVAACPVGC